MQLTSVFRATALPAAIPAILVAHLLGSPPAQAAKAASMTDCFRELEFGSAPAIVCEFPLHPSAAERAEMEKNTAGYLKDATCIVSINVPRALVTAAIATPDYEFDAPPQPVACTVSMPGKEGPDKTGDTKLPISGTFAPHVSIKGSVAIKASPGLGDVKGVSQMISIPIAAYINRAGFLRDGMLKVVNAWMTHMRTAKTRKG